MTASAGNFVPIILIEILYGYSFGCSNCCALQPIIFVALSFHVFVNTGALVLAVANVINIVRYVDVVAIIGSQPPVADFEYKMGKLYCFI